MNGFIVFCSTRMQKAMGFPETGMHYWGWSPSGDEFRECKVCRTTVKLDLVLPNWERLARLQERSRLIHLGDGQYLRIPSSRDTEFDPEGKGYADFGVDLYHRTVKVDEEVISTT